MTMRCDREVFAEVTDARALAYICSFTRCALAANHRGECEPLTDEREERERAEGLPPNPGTRLEASGHRSCNLCDAVDNGNLTCWACIARWPPSPSRTQWLSIMKERTPEKPCDVDDVERFVAKFDKRERSGG